MDLVRILDAILLAVGKRDRAVNGQSGTSQDDIQAVETLTIYHFVLLFYCQTLCRLQDVKFNLVLILHLLENSQSLDFYDIVAIFRNLHNKLLTMRFSRKSIHTSDNYDFSQNFLI